MTDAYHDSYCYMYEYNQAGRVTTQAMAVNGAYSYNNKIGFSATYQWDTEGRMTSLGYPTVTATGSFGNMPVNMPIAAFQYDANGRLNGMTMDDQNGYGPQPFASASYTSIGQLYHLSYGGYTETRTYNTLGQLITQSVPGAMNMTYSYSATQNNGRITGSVDAVTGENTSYTYDALNRLTGATNSLWTGSYSYDGFGNLTQKAETGQTTMNATYNANNQQSGASYDANGNSVGAYPYGWSYSVENRMTWQTNYGRAPRICTHASYVNGMSAGQQEALMLHGMLHNITGMGDDSLQGLLGIAVGGPSVNISNKLQTDCFN